MNTLSKKLKSGDRHRVDKVIAENSANCNELLMRKLHLASENEYFSDRNENTAKHVIGALKSSSTNFNAIEDAREENEARCNLHAQSIK